MRGNSDKVLTQSISDPPACPRGHTEVQWGEELLSVRSKTAQKCFSGSLQSTNEKTIDKTISEWNQSRSPTITRVEHVK